MSKRVKSKASSAPPKQSSQTPYWKPWIPAVVVVVLAAIPFCMGKYCELNSPGPFDSASNVYSAKHILDGARIGIDERPSADIGTLMANIIGVWVFGFSETGPKLIQGLLQALALIVMFVVLRRLYGVLAAAVAVTIASIYLSAPLIAKFGNVKDQFMIAMAILGVCCYVLHQLKPRWWMAVLAGGCLAWAPLFKETGYAASVAVGLFWVLQPFLKYRSWKENSKDLGYLVLGAALAMAPLVLWVKVSQPLAKMPHANTLRVFTGLVSRDTDAADAGEETIPDSNTVAEAETAQDPLWLKLIPAGYAREGWRKMTPADRKTLVQRVFRYYGLLVLPIALALLALVARFLVWILVRTGKLSRTTTPVSDRFVLLFAIWWLVDMLFVWGSPRSYEQYYLPLNASAAMLGAYFVSLYARALIQAKNKTGWIAVGAVGVLVMMGTSWHIFFGISKSPHSGGAYPQKRRGYAQKIKEVRDRKLKNQRGAWETLGDHIRKNSDPNDGIYVWGWYPGIYVQAQRLSPAPKAFEALMHTLPPEQLTERIDEIITAFQKNPPKFIVDSRKSHFPWIRPNLELWAHQPRSQSIPGLHKQLQEYLKRWPWQRDLLDPKTTAAQRDAYDEFYCQFLEIYMKAFERGGRGAMDPLELERYRAMRRFRDYVMDHYHFKGTVGSHMVFKRKPTIETRTAGSTG